MKQKNELAITKVFFNKCGLPHIIAGGFAADSVCQ